MFGAAAVLASGCGSTSGSSSGGSDGSGPIDIAPPSTEATSDPPSTTAPPAATASTAAEAGGDGQEQEAEAAFELYRAALEARDGAAAVAHLSAGTLDWYEEARVHALSAGEDVLLGEIPLLQAIAVIRLRAEIGEELRTMTAEDVVVRGVDAGWVGDSVAVTTLDGVELGQEGEAFGLLDGFPLFRLVQEGAAWKVDLPYTMDQTVELAGEELLIQQLSGGEAATREELFTILAPAFGTTWEQASQPLDQ
jgi:hypothetical protein